MELHAYVYILAMCVFLYALTGTGKVLPNPKAAFKFKTGVVLLIGTFFSIFALALNLLGISSLTMSLLWLTFSTVMAYGLSLENNRCKYVKELDPKQYEFMRATGEFGHNSKLIRISDIPETKLVRFLKKATSTSIFLWVGSLLINVFGPLIQ